MTDKIEEEQFIKGKSVSEIIHDLRTPLSTIEGFSEMLLRKFDQNEELKREWIEALVRESKRLENVIEQDLSSSITT